MKEVLKFGGTSVDKLDLLVSIILEKKEFRPYICVSAFSGVTDLLLSFIQKLEHGENWGKSDYEELKKIHLKKIEEGVENDDAKKYLYKKFDNFFLHKIPDVQKVCMNLLEKGFNYSDHDALLGFGEQLSAFLVSEYISFSLRLEEVQGKYIDLSHIIKGSFKSADHVFFQALRESLIQDVFEKKEDNEILIFTGYFGRVPGGILYSIDRGYTDFMAAFLSSLLKVDRFTIFKEVDGVCSTDPSLAGKNCLLLSELSYLEVLKMASGGMKAVNTEAVRPAMKAEIPIEVRNILYPNSRGTRIIKKRELHERRLIQNIPMKRNVCIVRFGGITEDKDENLELKLLQFLEKHRLKKFFSTTDIAGTSVVLPYNEKKIDLLMEDLRIFGNVYLNKNCAIVAIVGEEMRDKTGVIAKASSAMASEGICIYMTAQGASRVAIDFVVLEEDVERAVKKLHEVFF
jgi:bifunctional aspartokinase / homoserine dehydrogenase 1